MLTQGDDVEIRVPVGKLGNERTVPLEKPTLECLDTWMAARGGQRALPHPRHGRPAEFVFMERGRRLTSWRLAKGLDQAAAALTRPDGSPAHLTLHQLRHTFGTSLKPSGVGLDATFVRSRERWGARTLGERPAA